MKIDTEEIDKDTLIEHLTPKAGRLRAAWTSEDGLFIILEVKLENHRKLVDSIGSMEHVESITSSGKIRLVKSRVFQLMKSH